MANESDYIIEWVAWHRLHGFDLIIANNCSSDRQKQLLEALQKHGYITLVDARSIRHPPQMAAYRKIYFRALAMGYRYIGFLDADEFIDSTNSDQFNAADFIIKSLRKFRIFSVSYRWAIFGSHGQIRKNANPVVERFTMRADASDSSNLYFKSFAKISAVAFFFWYRPWTGNPHRFRIPKYFTKIDGKPAKLYPLETHKWSDIRIRHYPIKSREEFEGKRQRGDAFFDKKIEIRNEVYWSNYDKNNVHDPIKENELRMLKDTIKEIENRLLDESAH